MARLFDSKQFRTDLQLSGSFSGSFHGDGSSLTNVPASGIIGLNLSQIGSGSATASISPDKGLQVNTSISGSVISGSTLIISPTGSFNHIITDGETIEFLNPTTKAQIGRLKFDPTTGLNIQDNTGARTKVRAGRGEFLSLEAGPVGFNSIGAITGSIISASSTIFANDIEAFAMNVTHFTASFITASTIETSGSNIFGDESSDTHTFVGDIIAENNITASGNIRMQTTAPNISIQRTSNSNNASIDFIGQAGVTGAQIQFSGSSNELTFGTYDGSSVIERLRIEDGTTPNIIITGSTNISGSATSTASFGTYIGDGSGLTGLGGAYGISNSNGVYTYYATLSASIAAASAGDVVEVFADVIETNPVTILFKNGVNIQGNGHTYTLDYTGSEAAFADYMSENTTTGTDISSSINNFNIRRLNGDSSKAPGYGSTIRIENRTSGKQTTLDLHNSTIYNDTAITYNCNYRYGQVDGGYFHGDVDGGNGFVLNASSTDTKPYLKNARLYFPTGWSQVEYADNCQFIGESGTYALNAYGRISNCYVYSKGAISANAGGSNAALLGCHVENGSSGIAARSFYRIADSTIISSTGFAVRTYGNANCEITNNRIYASGYVALDQYTNYSSGKHIISNNLIITDSTTYAACQLRGAPTNDFLFSNNTVFNRGDNANSHGVKLTNNGTSHQVYMANNTIKVFNAGANCITAAASVDAHLADNIYDFATTPVNTFVTQSFTNVPDEQGNIHVTSSLNNDRIYSGSFSGSYVGDGSQLSGIVTETNFTQSLFVTPAGNNSTAVVGDMMKPFSSILGATGSANPGDTIIVYPGTYIEDRNLYKDGVNYHFLDGAKVVANSPVEPMWGGGSGQSNTIAASSNFSSSISITGHGEFISTSSNAMASAIFYLRAPSGVIEFKKATKHGFSGGAYKCLAAFGQWSAQDSTGTLTIRGSFENSGSTNSYGNVVGFMEGNINTDIVVRQHGAEGIAVRLWSDSGDINGTMDVYSEGYCLFTQARTSALSYLKGRFETLTSNQGSNYALYFGPGYRGNFHVDAEIRGAIYINTGGAYEASVHVRGYQEVSNSPGGGAVVIGSGDNQLSQKIYGVSGNAAFKVTGGRTTYDGQVRVTGYNSKVFDISAGTFYWKGSCAGSTSYPTTRTDPNVVSGGELIIESQFESFSQAASVNNEYMFNLSGGTLDIQSKLRNNIDQVNNGIINMTGGYLRMNGAELVHATQTGSFAYAIDLNGQTHSGSILNNCFTNLQPFNSGSFTNEIVGGGTLFESHKLY